ncbi:MAG: polysaccharide biosynthesis/export family protein [Bacteroidia bacterium]|nr:polysaccharide biosynthesis/export family protein [Bacteroidia bacterium]NNC86032.1 hypothetical protein [Bacteroidia bacterium]
MLKKYLLILLVFAGILSSCTPQKKLIYFQHGEAIQQDSASLFQPFELKIYPNDILQVQLYTINPDALPSISSTMDRSMNDNRSVYEKGFMVDNRGYVTIPLIGEVYVAGLTLDEAKLKILNEYKRFIESPTLVLRKLSFRISVLGEVNNPGLIYVPGEKITLIEAIAMAGDLTNFADRTEIKILRTIEGQNQEIVLDLTSKELLFPNPIYLYPDDIVYIKPVKRKALANVSPGLTVITSIITTAVVTLSLILRETN